MPRAFRAYIFCVNAARNASVVGTLDNGASVREQRYLVATVLVSNFRAQHELAHFHFAMTAQAFCNGFEVHALGRLAVPQLHRVSTAECRGAGPGLAIEIVKLPLPAAPAIRFFVGVAHIQLHDLVHPQVEAQQGATDVCEIAREDFQRFGDLEIGNDTHGRTDDADRVASGAGARRWRFFEQAAK